MRNNFPSSGNIFIQERNAPSMNRVKIYAIFSLVLILIGGALSYWVAYRIKFYISEIIQAEEVMQLSDELYSSILEQESSIRGYLITGRVDFLKHYEVSLRSQNELFEELRALTSENKIQQRALRELQGIVQSRVEIHEKSKLYYLENKNLEGFINEQLVENAISDYHEIKNIIGQISIEESKSFDEKNSSLINNIKALPYIVSLISFFSIAMGILTLFSIFHYNRSQQKAQAQNEAYQRNLKNKLDLLDESNKQLEQFAYVASHDLQEPLRKITTFSGLLNEQYSDKLEGEGSIYLKRMIASSNRMRRLIKDLLEYSRAARESESNFETVKLNTVVTNAIDNLEIIIREKQATIKVGKLPSVQANQTELELEQVFQNLISNSIKFSKPGVAPLISIEASLASKETVKRFPSLSHDQKYHLIQVSDNGIGFNEEYSERIFTIFQRLHGKTEYEGTGIGLAITKKIIEKYKGVIFAESIPDVGSTFNILMPKFN